MLPGTDLARSQLAAVRHPSRSFSRPGL